VIVTLMSAVLIAQTGAAPGPGGRLQDVRPNWLRKATREDVWRVYPRDARRHGVEGVALVSCQVTEKGELADCAVLLETPSNEGFGEAALKLMRLFAMRPATSAGTPVGGSAVTLPIQFRMPRLSVIHRST
jgi:periplasmic protein TonB